MRSLRTRILLAFGAVLAAIAISGAMPAHAAGEAGPALRPPIDLLTTGTPSQRRGLNLEPPATPVAKLAQSAAAQPLAADDPSTEERAGLRAYLDVERSGAPFAPVAGIVYGF